MLISPLLITRCSSGRSFFANVYHEKENTISVTILSNNMYFLQQFVVRGKGRFLVLLKLTISSLVSPIFLPANLFIHSVVLSPSLDMRPGTTRGMVVLLFVWVEECRDLVGRYGWKYCCRDGQSVCTSLSPLCFSALTLFKSGSGRGSERWELCTYKLWVIEQLW